MSVRRDPVTFDEAMRYCESPIEARFLAAFSAVCLEAAEDRRRKDEGDQILIQPQARLGDYRVDFLISQGATRLIVECDGHDFHNVTKQQALNDRKRDRWLHNDDYVVFRFTGSEIYADPKRCAEAAFRYLDDRAVPFVDPNAGMTVNPFPPRATHG